MADASRIKGHLVALITVLVWGLTFVSTKVLLESFSPIEILFLRFALGFVILCLLSPRVLRLSERKHEWYFIAAGATGTFLYYLLENIALVYASASNIGVTVSVAPLFTAIIATLLGRERALTPRFICGFVVAMAGIVLISGQDSISQNAFAGDVLAVGAALMWALYSNIIASFERMGYGTIAATKRTFAWGLLFIALSCPFFGADLSHASALFDPVNLGNLAFLGAGASAGCFVTWSLATRLLGVSKASAYIYLPPAITVVASALILGEPITPLILLGMALVLSGLFLSAGGSHNKAVASDEPSA